jgi:uroporphyrinogen decarboxylase
MRQAGRYMPEYRALRERHAMLDVIRTPELAVEVTLQPIKRFDLDAAIIFADILPPLIGMGIDLEFARGEGPVIHNPLRSPADIDRLHVPPPEENVPWTLEAIRLARHELSGKVPLIGFAGAPFTLASYMIEGGSSRNYLATKRLMYEEPEAWQLLMDKLAELVGQYLAAQVAAGAQAVQIFDSWAGCLSPADYRRFVQPYNRRVVDTVCAGLKQHVAGGNEHSASAPINERQGAGPALASPIIYFSTDTSGIILGSPDVLRDLGASVVGVDWRVDLGTAWERIGHDLAIQGNLDPVVLFAGREEIERQAAAILRQAGERPGHIFNLGHGILPGTPMPSVELLIDFVHSWQA